MTTPYLGITELANGQVNQYLTLNEGLRVIEQAICGRRTIDFASDANYTLETAAGSEEWRDKFLTFTDTGVVLTGGVDVVFPAEQGPEYIVTNNTAQTITLKISGQTGVALSASASGRFYYDGSDIVSGP